MYLSSDIHMRKEHMKSFPLDDVVLLQRNTLQTIIQSTVPLINKPFILLRRRHTQFKCSIQHISY